jgi:hypothetical protein
MRNTGLINAKPYIVWINDSSERFLSLKTEFIQALLDYKVCKYDVLGAIVSCQWGNAMMSARRALHFGIKAYLKNKGYNPPGFPLFQLRLLEIAVGEKTELYNKSRELTFVNPDTPEEIKNYAERCFAFVEENLGIRYSWKYAEELKFAKELREMLKPS